MPPEAEAMDGRSRGRRREERAEEADVRARGKAEGRRPGASGGPGKTKPLENAQLSPRPRSGGAMDGDGKSGEPWMANAFSVTGVKHAATSRLRTSSESLDCRLQVREARVRSEFRTDAPGPGHLHDASPHPVFYPRRL